MVTNEQWAWLAGIIDGEGTITATMEKPRKYKGESRFLKVYISVTNTDNRITLACREITQAGSIVYYKPENKRWQGWSRWQVGCEPACKVVEKILPFLVSKKEQAIHFLKWRTMPRFVGRHEKGSIAVPTSVMEDRRLFVCTFRELNHRGGEAIPRVQMIKQERPVDLQGDLFITV